MIRKIAPALKDDEVYLILNKNSFEKFFKNLILIKTEVSVSMSLGIQWAKALRKP